MVSINYNTTVFIIDNVLTFVYVCIGELYVYNNDMYDMIFSCQAADVNKNLFLSDLLG